MGVSHLQVEFHTLASQQSADSSSGFCWNRFVFFFFVKGIVTCSEKKHRKPNQSGINPFVIFFRRLFHYVSSCSCIKCAYLDFTISHFLKRHNSSFIFQWLRDLLPGLCPFKCHQWTIATTHTAATKVLRFDSVAVAPGSVCPKQQSNYNYNIHTALEIEPK